ncbi:hypothetical protein G6M89_11930 [Natronolimnobius sp. AArcel1]|uniref:hypothetical protein n=1 Tax=Natronolimnobius sp. AArcel1 TaxID=1679093 RepID=UPI0013EA32C1|nr:hypothetical protein [Natronolimnobius sp. AArcel1]NGM69708.1 hypothetical protein [Natronolimnobius sp. AArcel1]
MDATETATLEGVADRDSLLIPATGNGGKETTSQLRNALDSDTSLDSTDDLVTLLCATIAVERTESGQLRLEPSFRTDWTDRLLEIRERETHLETLAAHLEIDARRLELSVEPDGFVATCDRDRVGCWPSNAALLADLAAASVLEVRGENWHALDGDERGAVLTALRLFLEWCPNCDGEIHETELPTGSLAGESTGLLPDSSRQSPPNSLESTGGDLALACASCGVMFVRKPYAAE